MPSRAGRISITVTVVLICILLVCLILLLPLIPSVVDSLLAVPDNIGNRAELLQGARTYVLVCTFAMYFVALDTLVYFLFLLHRVYSGKVFTPSAYRLIFTLVLCCFAEAILFASIGFCFQLAYGVALAAGILGVSLLVTRSVLMEAGRIKAENDFTI